MSTPPQSAVSTSTPQLAVSASLYDALRDRYYVKPLLRGWLHLVWFAASLVGGIALVASAHGAARLTAASIYATSVCGLFGASAIYHRGNWSPRVNATLQRVDHVMIFMLIAGTATPAFLLAVPGRYGVTGLIVLWTLTAVATGVHMLWMDAPELLVGSTFIGLGLTAGLSVPPLWLSRGTAAGVLVLVGGVLYILGAVAYHRRKPDPFPTVFGYHEVFHAFVCAAATCHYVAIAAFVL